MSRRSRLGCWVAKVLVAKLGCWMVVWLSLPQHSIVLLCSWPFHITHQILLSVSKRLEKPNSPRFERAQ